MKVKILTEGSRPNEIGYHFTDIDGLLKILESDKLLATNEPLDNKEIKRYNLKFPDNSEINISNIDSDSRYISQWLTGIPSDELNFVLKRLKNNKLKDKIKQFKGEYKAYSYNYTPFKNILGKKSWSYTRRPEGTSYRNMTTFEEHTVRIDIDIDKLTEKGNKIVPFSWLQHPKSGEFNEYEERIFPRNGEFTPNFTQFITEIAVCDNFKQNVEKFLKKYINIFFEAAITSIIASKSKIKVPFGANKEYWMKDILKRKKYHNKADNALDEHKDKSGVVQEIIDIIEMPNNSNENKLKQLEQLVAKSWHNKYYMENICKDYTIYKKISDAVTELLDNIPKESIKKMIYDRLKPSSEEFKLYLDSNSKFDKLIKLCKKNKIKLITADSKGRDIKKEPTITDKQFIDDMVSDMASKESCQEFLADFIKADYPTVLRKYKPVYDFLKDNYKQLELEKELFI